MMTHLLKRVIAAATLTAGLLFSLSAAKAQTTISGDTTGKPTFVHPVPKYNGQLGNDGAGDPTTDTAPYEVKTFTPSVTGRYRIIETANFDNLLYVYTGTFDPNNPADTNNLASNDDFPYVGTSGFGGLQLTAGTTYTFVTTGAGADTANNIPAEAGTYTITIALATVTGTTTGAPTYARATNANETSQPTVYPLTGVTAGGYRYAAIPITFSTSGLYRFQTEAVTNAYDMFITLYKGTFDPNNAANNAVIANDDSPTTNAVSVVDYGLVQGQTYTLVVSSYDTTTSGDFRLDVTRLADTQVAYTNTTTGRPTLNFKGQSFVGSTHIEAGTAVPYRIIRFDLPTAGTYYFKFFNTSVPWGSWVGYYRSQGVNPNNLLTNALALDLYVTSTNRFVSTIFTYERAFTVSTAPASLYYLVTGVGNSDAGSFRVETYGPGAVTATPVTYVSGNVKLQTLIDNPPTGSTTRTVPITFRYRPVGASGSGTDVVRNFTFTVSATSTGDFFDNIPEGNYNVGIKSPRTLQKVVGPINTTSTPPSLGNVVLTGADANDDNFTDINDLLVLIGAYNQVSPAAGYSALADFNFDGVNDINDLLIIIGSYNQAGQFLP